MRRACGGDLGEIFHRFVETQLRDLVPVGIGREAKSAGRRQPSPRQRRKVRRFWSDAVGIACIRFAKWDDEAVRHFT
jgi:hypothetical protein